MSNTEALPPLPDPAGQTDRERGYPLRQYTADQMRAYARQALAQPAASGEPLSALVATELERLAQDPPISGNTLAQARLLMTAANVREFGLAGGATSQPAPAPAASGEPLALLERGEGGAFKLRYVADNLLAIYALPPGNHLLYTAQPAPARVPTEPVAWMTRRKLDGSKTLQMGEATTNREYAAQHKEWEWVPLYTAPQPAPAPFTQAQMKRLYDNSPERHNDVTSRYAFYRIVMLAERAHGITATPAPTPEE